MSNENAICRIKRCDDAARWIVTITGHPNTDGEVRSAYCHEHAEGEMKLLWDESPRDYTKTVKGPYPNGIKGFVSR